MTSSENGNTVGIIGAGTMGAGIAQVAAMYGWDVWLMDVDDSIARAGVDRIASQVQRLVEKGKMTAPARKKMLKRLEVANAPADFGDCALMIEAILEDLNTKKRVLTDLLGALRDDCIVATNTSSLSVSRIAESLPDKFQPRTVGMHFFNPAPVMRLVEVIAGEKTDEYVVNRTAEIAESWGKKVARAKDMPGFIVNHVARPYYLEAFRILEDGLADPVEIDGAMKMLGGFRMGPLELTDFIGHDVNTATTRNVWEELSAPKLLAPSQLQEQMVKDGALGRKSGRGVYDYSISEKREGLTPSIKITRENLILDDRTAGALDAFVERAVDEKPPGSDQCSRYIFARILAGLIAQAHFAHDRGVASKHDIDTALKFGVNYPRGPFEWEEMIGTDVVRNWLAALNQSVGDGRFAISD